MGRVLLYGVDGRTPIAREADAADKDVLVLAFGYATGLVWARVANDPMAIEMAMDRARQELIQRILVIEGMAAAIGAAYDVAIGVNPEGTLVIRAAEPLNNPPGPPLGHGEDRG